MTEGLKTTIFAGIFTLLGGIGGTIISKQSDKDLARQKQDFDLVAKAMESKSGLERLETLRFLSETHLLSDDTVSKYIKIYVDNVKVENVPRIAPDHTVVVGENPSSMPVPDSSLETASTPKSNPALAKQFEREGFDYLVKKNVTAAISSFSQSDSCYNGYHMVYDIKTYLKANEAKLKSKDANSWKTAYTEILKNYSWRMPDAIKTELKTLSKQELK